MPVDRGHIYSPFILQEASCFQFREMSGKRSRRRISRRLEFSERILAIR